MAGTDGSLIFRHGENAILARDGRQYPKSTQTKNLKVSKWVPYYVSITKLNFMKLLFNILYRITNRSYNLMKLLQCPRNPNNSNFMIYPNLLLIQLDISNLV